MLTVEDYGRIRRAHRDGLSIRAIAKKFQHSRRKVRDALRDAEPRKYTRQRAPAAPKLDPFKPVIDRILEDDEQAPPKQRHTGAQIFRRLKSEHGYSGGYDQVRRYVASHIRQRRETFIPLEHAPGQRAECDFGHTTRPRSRSWRAASGMLSDAADHAADEDSGGRGADRFSPRH